MDRIPESAILIGYGALSWNRVERGSDRYGTVTLNDENSVDEKICDNSYLNLDVVHECHGRSGKLFVQILETRDSTHIGDSNRNIYPSTPDKHEIIELGAGRFFMLSDLHSKSIGVKPHDGRPNDWLNPYNLYRCHEQTVNLYFIPD